LKFIDFSDFIIYKKLFKLDTILCNPSSQHLLDHSSINSQQTGWCLLLLGLPEIKNVKRAPIPISVGLAALNFTEMFCSCRSDGCANNVLMVRVADGDYSSINNFGGVIVVCNDDID
jgi:hypothetical protein